MMNDITLKLDKRTAEGKNVAKLRDNGLVPSIVYGGQDKPLLMQSALVETDKVVASAGRHTPIHLLIDGKKKLAIIKDIDRDPIKHKIRHLAFHTIRQNDVIHTDVSIKLIGLGHSIAERDGFVILQTLEQVEIKAKPADLPESIELSVEGLTTPDDKITVADIVLPKGVSYVDIDQDMSLVIANVYEPGAVQAANEAAGGEASAEDKVKTDHGDDTTPVAEEVVTK